MSRTPLPVAAALAAATFACEPSLGAGSGAAVPESSSSGAPTLPTGDDHPLLGVQAPEVSLAAQSGADSVNLGSERGKVVIVDFWATWCEPCKDSFPLYQSLVDKYAGKLVIIGVSEDEEPDQISDFASETGAKFPLAWDEGKSVASQYDPEAMPTSYVVDKNGIVRFVHGGFRSGDEAVIDQAVAALLAE